MRERPIHCDVVHAHVGQDRGRSAEPPRRRADAVAFRADVDGLAEPRRIGGLVHLYVAGVEAQDVADHQPHAVALDRLDDAPRRGGVVRERLL